MSIFNETEEYINEQVDILIESGLLIKISNEAKKLLKKGKAVFRKGIKKVVDKNTGEEIEDTENDVINHD